jgi:hypothetical protein
MKNSKTMTNATNNAVKISRCQRDNQAGHLILMPEG